MKLKREEGAVAVITAIVMVLLMFCVALTIDVGGMMLRRREMVNGADAAALSAAVTYVENRSTSGTDAVALAQFKANSPGSVSNSPGGIVASDLDWTFNDDGSGSVTVHYVTQQPLYFAPVMGFANQHAIASTATASWDGGSIGGKTYTYACGDPSNPASVPCKPGTHIDFCHYSGSDTGGGSGKYIPTNAGTTSTGPAGGHIPGHAFDVIPPYTYQQKKGGPIVTTPGVNWPILTNLPDSPVDYTWMIGMPSSSFVGGGCAGTGPHVWLSN
jgi:Flp pilus assembly protein TadG